MKIGRKGEEQSGQREHLDQSPQVRNKPGVFKEPEGIHATRAQWVCPVPWASVTDDHKLSSLKQWECIRLPVLEARGLKGVSAGHASSEGSRGGFCPASFQLLVVTGNLWSSSAGRFSTPISAFMFTWCFSCPYVAFFFLEGVSLWIRAYCNDVIST